ncbi:MAG: HDOD domain-containing protein [Nitrospirota bacterium]
MTPAEAPIKERLFKVKDLPTIPTTHGQILKLIADVNYSVDEVSRLIERDQVLSTKVLKLVNSPFYGLYSEVAAVRRAVILLGANLIRGIVLSTSLFDLAEEKLPGLWDHSYCCSLVSGFLAKRFNLITIEEIMTGALLHDIGKILIKKQLPAESRSIEETVRTSGITALEAEKKVITFGHDYVGLWLAETWNFPKIIQDTISYHHRPSLCAAHFKEVMIVHLSDVVVKGVGVVSSGDPFVPLFDGAGWDKLGLPEGDLVDLIVEVVDIIQGDPLLSRYLGRGAL